MNKEKIRNYIEKRYNTEEILNLDEESRDSIFFTAFVLLSVFYSIEVVDVDIASQIIAEEAIFLSKFNIDFNAYYQYEGLSSFDIAGAIKGSVEFRNNELFSPIVKAMLEREGLVQLVSYSRVKNSYTYL